MDRPIIQVGELPCAEDFLGLAKDALFGLGFMAQAAIGPNTGISGLGIAPTAPASLSVTIASGSMYIPGTADANGYGVLGTDSTSIIKQGILSAPVTLTITPPGTSGFSQVFLVQVGYSDVDGGATLVPFYNSSNPSAPSSSTQNTIRQGKLIVQLKAGVAAVTGSQTVPAPDAGFSPVWVITVANGASTITSANWYKHPQAPFFPYLEELFSLFVAIVPQSTFYVNNSALGSDTNGDGLTPTTPWATINHAVTVLSAYNLNGRTVTIQLANTGLTYNETLVIAAPNSGTLVIRGDPANQASYIIAGSPPTSGDVIGVQSGAVELLGLTVRNTSSSGSNVATCYNNSALTLVNVTLNVSGSNVVWHLGCEGGSTTIGSGCFFSGSAAYMMVVEFAGQMIMAGNISVFGAPTFSGATMNANNGGVFYFAAPGGWFFSGTATGPRYTATLNGIINTSGGGAGFFPGSSAGSAPTGIYV